MIFGFIPVRHSAILGPVQLVDIETIGELSEDKNYAQSLSTTGVLITTAIADWRSRKGHGPTLELLDGSRLAVKSF